MKCFVRSGIRWNSVPLFLTCLLFGIQQEHSAAAQSYSIEEVANTSCQNSNFEEGPGEGPDMTMACSDCGPCPPIYVISVNGINAQPDGEFHWWIERNIPHNGHHWLDPYSDPPEWCDSNPTQVGEEIRREIEEVKQQNPCMKVVLVGHSLGGVASWFARHLADCAFFIDPPIDCRPVFGQLLCPAMRSICKAKSEGIERHPGYIPTKEHTPFENPELHCDDLERIRRGLDECIQRLRPNCPTNNPLDPLPDCELPPHIDPTEEPMCNPFDPEERLDCEPGATTTNGTE